ncbi:MAG: hypothetical protein LAO31_18010 [Acidobacteriia bacterium]|nr:hypothetical protein [Terriglobia bacterium]
MSLFLYLGLLLMAHGSYGQEPRAQISLQIGRLEHAINSAPDSDQSADDTASLQQVRKAFDAGYVYASLYGLEPAMLHITTLQYTLSKSTLESKGLEAFEEEWLRVGTQLDKEEQSLTGTSLASLPSAVRAMVEAAQVQSRTYYQAARLYGRETTTQYGLQYLGLSKGYLDFAVWCSQLQFPTSPSWKAHSPGDEIAALERDVIRSYNQPQALKQNEQFIGISSRLKFARELDEQGRWEAALQVYLNASLAFGLIDPPSTEGSKLSTLQKESKDLRNRLAAGPLDQSLGQLYWEIAQLDLEGLASKKIDNENANHAGVLLKEVLPRYLRYLEHSAVTASAALAAAKVTVTLVRWPYT